MIEMVKKIFKKNEKKEEISPHDTSLSLWERYNIGIENLKKEYIELKDHIDKLRIDINWAKSTQAGFVTVGLDDFTKNILAEKIKELTQKLCVNIDQLQMTYKAFLQETYSSELEKLSIEQLEVFFNMNK